MNKEEILYNEIYEQTKDFGRTHFIKEIMRLQRELEQLKEIEKEHQRMNGNLRIEIKELKEENQKYKEVIDKAINNSQYWIDYYTRLNSDERIALRLQENIDILKEVE